MLSSGTCANRALPNSASGAGQIIYLGRGLYYISPQLGYVPTQRVPRPLMCSTPVSAPVSAFHAASMCL
jgi:hypothetical protein